MNDRGRRILMGSAIAALGIAGRAAVLSARRYDLNGKVVLITGGSRGLGFVLGREFARRGATVAACARQEHELAEARRRLALEGVTLHTDMCDVSDQDAFTDLVKRVESRLGPIDVLVNNAGTIAVGPEESMTVDDYRLAMDTHFWGPLYGMEAVLPAMKQRRSGRIVNVASIGGKLPVPHLAPYSASKFALVGLSEALHAELAPYGVAITTVCPGLMRTGSPENATFKGKHQEEYAWFAVSDSLPGLSISAESAAKQIVDACVRGDSETVLSVPAKLGAFAYGAFPTLTLRVLKAAARVLPAPGGIGSKSARGNASHSGRAVDFLTGLTQKAARANNEFSIAYQEQAQMEPSK